MHLQVGAEVVEDFDELGAGEGRGADFVDVVVEFVEAAHEDFVLVYVGFGDAFEAAGALDDGEVGVFFAVVVIVEEFGPALAEDEEGGGAVGADVFGLEVEGVHAADDNVMNEGHFGRGYDELVGILRAEFRRSNFEEENGNTYTDHRRWRGNQREGIIGPRHCCQFLWSTVLQRLGDDCLVLEVEEKVSRFPNCPG